MKILMVNKFLYPNGGSETYMFKLGKCLKEMGHQVEYFGMEDENRCVENNIGAYTSNMDFHTSSPINKIKMSFKTIYSKEAKQKIRLVLDDFKPDIVHLNNFNYQLTPSIIIEIREWEKQSGQKVKIIYTAHDYQLICPNHALFKNNEICEECIGGNYKCCFKNKCVHNSAAKSLFGTLEANYWNKKKVYKEIDTIICCSKFMKTKLDTNPLLRDKTLVMQNFVDKIERKDYEKEDYILYFGRLSEEKGIDILTKSKDKKFIVAGSGPLEDEVKNTENIEFVGFKTGEELISLISKAKASVYPSIWYENCPFSIMESVMYGTPVVASKIGGIPELIEEGKTGYLFEARNENEFNDALDKISNKKVSETMSKNCFNYNFDTVEDYTKKIIRIYSN